MQVVCSRRCFMLAGGPVPSPHRWVILTDPEGVTPKVIAVMIRSAKFYTDKTLILDTADYPPLDRPSSVDYGMAQPWKVSRVISASSGSGCGMEPDVSPQLLDRLRAGLFASSHTTDWVKEYCSTRFK